MISTFLHILSDDEAAELLDGCDDTVIKAFIHALCDRPFLAIDSREQPSSSQLLTRVDAQATLQRLKQRHTTVAPASSSSSPTEQTPLMQRVDLDRCGALVSCVVTMLVGATIEVDVYNLFTKTTHTIVEHELMRSAVKSTAVGKDVCYGPAYMVSAADAAALAQRMGDGVSRATLDALFDDVAKFPQCLGGIGAVNGADRGYYVHHCLSFHALLMQAVALDRGLLIHAW